MATVGNLFINVNASTAKFNSKMKGAQKRLSMFKSAVAGIGSALAGAFAIKSIVSWTSAAMQAVDEMAKLAHAIGVTVADVQLFSHAANIAGIETTKAQKALRDMVRRVGEAAMGTGEASDGLKALGLSASKLSKQNAPEMFAHIAETIGQIPDVAERASIAYKIFGRSGVELLNVMDMGADGMANMRREMEELGVLLTDLEAKQIEDANDAMTELGLVLDSIAHKFSVGLAPGIRDVSDAMKDSASGASSWAEEMGKALGITGAFVAGKGPSGGDVASVAGTVLKHASVPGAIYKLGKWASGLFGGSGASDDALQTAKTAGEQIGDSLLEGLDAAIEAGPAGPTALDDLVASWVDRPIGAMEKLEKEIRTLETAWVDVYAGWEAGLIDTVSARAATVQMKKQMEVLREQRREMNKPAPLPAGKAEFDPGVIGGLGVLQGIMKVELPDIKGMVDTVDTAIGSFRVEGDQRGHVQDRQLEVERQQLDALRQIGESVEAQQGLIGIMGLLR